jgi:hypothetical protein
LNSPRVLPFFGCLLSVVICQLSVTKANPRQLTTGN